ncbi:DUF4124 domain-containing protein [Guyparkeria halopsychrophila]|uniref:DUF4124 domain-containing protein n=1 Tax=Guyparkeria halopsychrophila TaxID=3139421 RepID=UPI0037CBAA0C
MFEVRFKRVWGIALLSAMAGVAAGQESETVYKCTHSDGRIVYSDAPCTGKMEKQTVTAPEAGRGGEAAREGINRLAREYDERREAEQQAREEAERRALERRLSNPEVVVVAPWRDQPRSYPYYPRGQRHLPPYDRYRDPPHGGMHLNDDGLSLWFGSGRHGWQPQPPYQPRHDPRERKHHDGRDINKREQSPRRPGIADRNPLWDSGMSGRYPGGLPGAE